MGISEASDHGLSLLSSTNSQKPLTTHRIISIHIVSINMGRWFLLIVYSAPPAPYDSQRGIYSYIIQDKSIKQIKTYDNSLTAYSPALSPDEKKVAFLLRHGPNEPGTSPYFIRIMTINIDGTDEILVKELIESNVIESFVTWSPDGTKLAYNYGSGVIGDQGPHIFIINSDGTGLTQVTNNNDYDGAPSWIK